MKTEEIKLKDLSKVDFDSPELKKEYDLLLKRLDKLLESTNADWNRIDRVEVFSRENGKQLRDDPIINSIEDLQ